MQELLEISAVSHQRHSGAVPRTSHLTSSFAESPGIVIPTSQTQRKFNSQNEASQCAMQLPSFVMSKSPTQHEGASSSRTTPNRTTPNQTPTKRTPPNRTLVGQVLPSRVPNRAPTSQLKSVSSLPTLETLVSAPLSQTSRSRSVVLRGDLPSSGLTRTAHSPVPFAPSRIPSSRTSLLHSPLSVPCRVPAGCAPTSSRQLSAERFRHRVHSAALSA